MRSSSEDFIGFPFVCCLLLVFVGSKVDACFRSPPDNTLVHFLRAWFVWFVWSVLVRFGSLGSFGSSGPCWFGVPVFLTVLHCSGSFRSLGHWSSFCPWLLVLVLRLWDYLHVGSSPVCHIWWNVCCRSILVVSFSPLVLNLSVYSSSYKIMAVPYSNRSALCTIPELCIRGKPQVTEAELRKSFLSVANPLKSMFACIQLLSANQVRFCFTSSRKMEDVMNTGLVFRGHPLTLGPIHSKKWVTVRRLAYGTPHEFVRTALAPYGTVATIRPEIVDQVATGTLFAYVDITKDIPSRLRIRGHNCVIWYREQPRTCFQCGQHGHERAHCPQRRGQHQLVPQQVRQVPGTPPRRHPSSPSMSPARSPSGPHIRGPPKLRRLATTLTTTLPSPLLRTYSGVTPGRSYAAATAHSPSTSNRFSILPVEDTPLPPCNRRSTKSKAPGKKNMPSSSKKGETATAQATGTELIVDLPVPPHAPQATETTPPPPKSPTTTVTSTALSPTEGNIQGIPSPQATSSAPEQMDSTPPSLNKDSPEASLPTPPEGQVAEPKPEGQSEQGDSPHGPPSKKPYQPTGSGPSPVTSPLLVGEAFLPLVAGIQAPFGLPSVPAAPTVQNMQAPTTTSTSKDIGAEHRSDIPPRQGPRPDKSASSSGKRKTRQDRPQGVKSFNPFTRRRTAPRPLVGATRRSASKATSRVIPEVQITPPRQKGTPPRTTPISQESPLLTHSGNLRSPKHMIPQECIPNPPFEGSASQSNQ